MGQERRRTRDDSVRHPLSGANQSALFERYRFAEREEASLGQPLIRMRFSSRLFGFLWPKLPLRASRRNRWRFSSDPPLSAPKASSPPSSFFIPSRWLPDDCPQRNLLATFHSPSVQISLSRETDSRSDLSSVRIIGQFPTIVSRKIESQDFERFFQFHRILHEFEMIRILSFQKMYHHIKSNYHSIRSGETHIRSDTVWILYTIPDFERKDDGRIRILGKNSSFLPFPLLSHIEILNGWKRSSGTCRERDPPETGLKTQTKRLA